MLNAELRDITEPFLKNIKMDIESVCDNTKYNAFKTFVRQYGEHKYDYGMNQILENEKKGINIDKLPCLEDVYKTDLIDFNTLYKYPTDLLDYVSLIATNDNGLNTQTDIIGVKDSEYYRVTIINKDFDFPIASKMDVSLYEEEENE